MVKDLLFGTYSEPRWAADLSLAVMRCFAGLAMALAHGLHKFPPSDGMIEAVGGLGFPFPWLFAWLAALTEFFGGILLALGLLTKPSAFLIAFTMVVAAFGRHAEDPFARKELALMYLVVMVFFMFRGGGRFSLDRLIKK